MNVVGGSFFLYTSYFSTLQRAASNPEETTRRHAQKDRSVNPHHRTYFKHHINKGCTNCPKTCKSLHVISSRMLKRCNFHTEDTKIRRHRTKFSVPSNLASEICTPLRINNLDNKVQNCAGQILIVV